MVERVAEQKLVVGGHLASHTLVRKLISVQEPVCALLPLEGVGRVVLFWLHTSVYHDLVLV